MRETLLFLFLQLQILTLKLLLHDDVMGAKGLPYKNIK